MTFDLLLLCILPENKGSPHHRLNTLLPFHIVAASWLDRVDRGEAEDVHNV